MAHERGPVTAYLDRLAPRSRRTYLGDAKSIAWYIFEPQGVAEFRTQSEVDGLCWHLLGVEQGVQLCASLAACYAPSTARRMLSCYRGILRECWRQGRMSAEALARAIDLPAVRGERVGRGRALSWAEVERLLAAGRCTRDRALLACMLGAGLRRAEAAALRRADVGRQAGRTELLVNGKGRRQRRVALPDWAAAALVEHMRYSGGVEPLFGTTSDGTVAGIVRDAAARAGLGVVSAHDLRRTYASLALSRGMSLATLRRSMGHASVKTTTLYDRRPDEEVLAEAARLDTGDRSL